jgi:hypothetical protein
MPFWNFDALLHGDLTYVAPMGTKIELHWELTHPPLYRKGLSARAAWKRAQTVELDGRSVWSLSPGDELRFLSVHCTIGHYSVEPLYVRPIWLVDIAQLVRALPPDWDWAGFVRETVALHLATPVLIVLRRCHDYLDLELPDGTMESLEGAAKSPRERQAWKSRRSTLFVVEGFQMHLASMNTLAQRGAFVRGIALPSPAWIRRHYAHTTGMRKLLEAYARYYLHLLRRIPAYVSQFKQRDDSSRQTSKLAP